MNTDSARNIVPQLHFTAYPQISVFVTPDLSKAFEPPIGVWKENYPPAMFEMLDNELYVWRQSNVEFQNKKPKTRRLKQRVPQGEVISSKLFNLYRTLCVQWHNHSVDYHRRYNAEHLSRGACAFFLAKNIKISANTSTAARMICGNKNTAEWLGRGKLNSDSNLPLDPRVHIRQQVKLILQASAICDK